MGSEASKNDDHSSSSVVGGNDSNSYSRRMSDVEQDIWNGERPHLQNSFELKGDEDVMSTGSESPNFDFGSRASPSTFQKPVTNKSDDWNAKFLLGNLENLPASARKLFSMGKLYLNGERASKREAGYSALFKTLPDSHADANRVPLNSDGDGQEDENSLQKTLAKQVQKISNLFVPMENSAPLNCAQTYVQWRAAHDLLNLYSFCQPTRNTIYIQPLDDFPQFVSSFVFHINSMGLTFFEMLQGFVQIFFSGMEVVVQPPVFVNDSGLNVRSRLHESTNQRQYCVTDLYPYLQKISLRDARCTVGVSWTDLYPEGFNFVLGEASNVHKAAVVSFGRFETTNYNAETHHDVSKLDGQLVWKLLKTISHEVCHVFGFSHCSFFLCAMNESSSVSDALSQPLFLCPVCLRKLQRVCGFDILDRYRLLRKFLSNIHSQMGDSQHLEDSISWLDTCIEYLTSTCE